MGGELHFLRRAEEVGEGSLGSGMFMATIFTLRRIWGEGGTLYKQRDNERIGANDMETLEDAVREAVKVQRFEDADLHKIGNIELISSSLIRN